MDTHPFRRLWRGYLRRHLPALVAAILLMALEGSSVGALSYMLEPMFDTIFVDGRLDLLIWVGLAIFGLFAMRAVAGVAHRIILARVGYDASARLQQDLLEHVLRLDAAYFRDNAPGLLIERVQGDVQAIQALWTAVLTSAARDAVGLVSLMVVAILVDPIWTACALVGAPLLLLPSLAVQRYIKRKAHLLRDIAATRTTRLDEIFHGIVPVKLNAMERYQSGRFQQATRAMVRATVRAQAGQASVPALVDLAVGLGFLVVLLVGGPQIVAGEKTIGEFMSFFTAMVLTFQPLRRLAGITGTWQTMTASLERIYALRDTAPTILDPADAGAAMPGDIRFEDVHLSYGDAAVLRGFDLHVREGETVALVGPSGAGKTTVFNVLTRLVEPQAGRVALGDRSLRDWPQRELRGLVSVVSQDTLLFDETLRENVLLGREDVSEERLRAALDAAHVTDFLPQLAHGLDTRAGPRGAALSGGQRQRVAIARALLRDTPILLLDEATSALDARSERLVQAALERLSEGRTTLVIAHRLSTVEGADRIAVMDEGRVVEEGPHADLLARGGAYAALHGRMGEPA